MNEPQHIPEPFRGLQPLTDDDPVRVDEFWLDARLTDSPAGIAYAAHEDHADEVMVLLLSEGAAADPAARARFSGEIDAMHIDTVVARGGEGQERGRMGIRYRSTAEAPDIALPPLAPWAALAYDGSIRAVDEAQRVLQAVDMAATAPLGNPSGPDYALHWVEETAPGKTRSWPLHWPSRRDRAGWITILISWLIMLLLGALGLILAILVFQNAPLVSPPSPIPNTGSGGEGEDSGDPQSGEPQSGEPQSGDPSQGEPTSPPTEEFTPTMGDPSEGPSGGGGEPTPNRRL